MKTVRHARGFGRAMTGLLTGAAMALVAGSTGTAVARARNGGSTVTAASQATPTTGARLSGSRPNIVYILADDLGYGDIGAYGQTKIETPNLDRIARNGLVFTQHYAGSTVCAPSRAALMTGLDTGHGQIRGNAERGGFFDANEFGQMPLAASAVTVADVLKKAGYTTALVGKWGLGGPNTQGVPNAHGFDHTFGYLDQKQAHNYYPTHLWKDGKRFPLNNAFFVPHPGAYGQSTAAKDYQKYIGRDYAPYRMLADATAFIDANKKRRFFLYFAPTIPHSALQVPDNLVARYKGRWSETPLDGGGYTPHPTPRAARAAMITELDRQVGALLADLDRQGLTQDTLVIFTSDNGPSTEGGQDLEFFNAAGGLRGMKRDLYEGGIREPMIAYWPGKVPTGKSTDHVSAFWDVMPTLADLAGVAAPTNIDGLSFADVLAGDPSRQEHDFLYWEFHGKTPTPSQAIRRRDWKLVRLRPEKKAVVIELYNLASDPHERTNVASAHPDVVRELTELIDAARTPSRYAGFNFDPSAAPPDPLEHK